MKHFKTGDKIVLEYGFHSGLDGHLLDKDARTSIIKCILKMKQEKVCVLESLTGQKVYITMRDLRKQINDGHVYYYPLEG